MKQNNTQLIEVMKHLMKHESITSWDAIQDYRITRLSAIIFTLRKEYNMNIDSHWKTGNGKRWTEYTWVRKSDSDESVIANIIRSGE
tara:strand:+ start:3628 stop:3888 length:261 start_codon:yes stop_codon:yes gene_type:complete